MDAIPLWIVFVVTVAVVLAAIEAGFQLGRIARRRSIDEKESSVSSVSASVLALVAFILAFTFGIVTDRYDARKALVRDEATAIGTAFLRTDLLPEPDRTQAAMLFRRYVDLRLFVVKQRPESDSLKQVLSEVDLIQRQLWEMAMTHVRTDLNSPFGALYLTALNEVFDIHALRVAVGLQSRMPGGIWMVLYILVILGMIGIGYQAAIADSRQTRILPILACAFSIVITLIASLDRPYSVLMPVSQQPLETLRDSLSGTEAGEQK